MISSLLIQVHIINQQVVSDERQQEFNLLSNVNSIYSDRYISGREEGEFHQAIVSTKVLDKSQIESIKVDTHVALGSLQEAAWMLLAKCKSSKKTLPSRRK